METTNKVSHTPGPWKVVGAFNGSDFAILPASSDRYSDRVALIEFAHSGIQEAEHPTEATANANLIAAAPDLLLALQKVLSYRDVMSPHIVGEIEDAIKKATE